MLYNQIVNEYSKYNRFRGRNGQPSPLLEMWELSPHLYLYVFKAIDYTSVAFLNNYPRRFEDAEVLRGRVFGLVKALKRKF